MLVRDLPGHLAEVKEDSIEATFGGLKVDDDCSILTIDDGSHSAAREFQFDEQLERSLARYLGVSPSYLAKCPEDLKAHNLNYWLDQKPNLAVVAETINDKIVTFHKPNLTILPLREVGDVITKAMDLDDEIVLLERDDRSFHIDILAHNKQVEVPPVQGIEDRQRGQHEVGDITRGGVRVLGSPTELKEPVVVPYLHRVWCTNGCSAPVASGAIKLRGNTVDDVLEEMNQIMRNVRANIDTKLADYAEMANLRVPGNNPSRYARQLGAAYNLSNRVMRPILDRVDLLPEELVSLYDIQQIFTQAANGQVPYKTMMALQTLAGDMAMDPNHEVRVEVMITQTRSGERIEVPTTEGVTL